MTTRHRLRPAAPGDESFLHGLFASSRMEMFAATGLPADQVADLLTMQWRGQRTGHAARHPNAVDVIVEVGDEPIGRELVDWGPAEVHLVDIALLPSWTGRGIGSALVRDLVEQARASSRAVVLEVARDNHRALALYRRLGFVDGDHSTPSHRALRHT